jgi:hypothetical protein
MMAMNILRLIVAFISLVWTPSTMPEIEQDIFFNFGDYLYRVPFKQELFGAPCTLNTDREEHTCHLHIRKPSLQKRL